MTATYDPTLDTKKDQLRFTIGDTGPVFFFQDEELNAVLARTDPAYPPGDPENGNVHESALICALSGMARTKGSASSRSIGPMSISDSSYERWQSLYDQLIKANNRVAGLKAVPMAYGYQPDRIQIGNARPLHARIGIHDFAGQWFNELYSYGDVTTGGGPAPQMAPQQMLMSAPAVMTAPSVEAAPEPRSITVSDATEGGWAGKWWTLRMANAVTRGWESGWAAYILTDGRKSGDIETTTQEDGADVLLTLRFPADAEGEWVVTHDGTPVAGGPINSEVAS